MDSHLGAGAPGAEAPAGYKHTVLGLLPSDWDIVPCGDLFVFKNGLNKEKRF